MAKFKVTLTQQERDELQSLIKTGKATARKINHACILLLSDEGEIRPGKMDLRIVELLDISVKTVERFRKRFIEEGLEQAVAPKPQPKRPGKVKMQGAVGENSSKWPAAILRKDVADGRCSCSRTKWSFSRMSKVCLMKRSRSR